VRLCRETWFLGVRQGWNDFMDAATGIIVDPLSACNEHSELICAPRSRLSPKFLREE
jgi:hypothetical protein